MTEEIKRVYSKNSRTGMIMYILREETDPGRRRSIVRIGNIRRWNLSIKPPDLIEPPDLPETLKQLEQKGFIIESEVSDAICVAAQAMQGL